MSNVPFGQGKGPFNSFPGVFSKDLILIWALDNGPLPGTEERLGQENSR